MQNKEKWKSSKFIYHRGKFRASRTLDEVCISSRLNVDLIASFYEKNLKKYAKGNLLDLGCGKVPLYEAYKQYVNENICVDWKNSATKNKFLDVYSDLNSPLPFKNNAYHTIILSDVLEHIKEPILLWKEMNRVLKEDGVLLLNVPFYYWIHEEPYDYYRYTKYALINMANESGFEMIELEALGGVPEILADILAKNTLRTRLIGKLSTIIIQKLIKAFTKTKYGNKFSKSTSNQFPLGYGLIAKKVTHNNV